LAETDRAKRAVQELWMAETKAAAELAFGAFIESYELKYEWPPNACGEIATRYWPSTTFPPSTGNTCARPTASKAPSPPYDPIEGLLLEQHRARHGVQAGR
jgi:hypothetical protein